MYCYAVSTSVPIMARERQPRRGGEGGGAESRDMIPVPAVMLRDRQEKQTSADCAQSCGVISRSCVVILRAARRWNHEVVGIMFAATPMTIGDKRSRDDGGRR